MNFELMEELPLIASDYSEWLYVGQSISGESHHLLIYPESRDFLSTPLCFVVLRLLPFKDGRLGVCQVAAEEYQNAEASISLSQPGIYRVIGTQDDYYLTVFTDMLVEIDCAGIELSRRFYHCKSTTDALNHYLKEQSFIG
ncbi:hypothetical protein [Aliikangiella sp. G2MR2-5]|uniref:hypothetical protein n=1 Tax=Aliikangiella sp. G2MR2-5 TaxID=2788943 RepID=UPI0018AAA799|nr:hypothetical protein [Aliikangiella sp. G2MR2-5]